MGKTRDLFKKIRDAKGTFHAKMGLIKDRTGMELSDLTQALISFMSSPASQPVSTPISHSPGQRHYSWILESKEVTSAIPGA